MCGIFGIVLKKTNINSQKRNLKDWSDKLFKLSESRGKEAAGVSVFADNETTVYKSPQRSSKFINSGKYSEVFEITTKASSRLFFLGHSRLATNGTGIKNSNNQPVWSKNGVLVHNGIVVNDDLLWRDVLKVEPKSELDSVVLLSLLEFYLRKGTLKEAFSKTFSKIEGSVSVACYLKGYPFLTLATNTGSLYYAFWDGNFVFASEFYILRKFLSTQRFSVTVGIKKLNAGFGIFLDLDNIAFEVFSLQAKKVQEEDFRKEENQFLVKDMSERNEDYFSSDVINNHVSRLKRHRFEWEKIKSLKRCIRCILPETMPLIYFDKEGVCNYCLSHKKIIHKGKSELERLVEPFRSKKSDEADCIMALSGGRDSSYGLHYLKKELGLNPIAYTYDWGMVTDIARRNQARLVGALGVEHVIVSADIGTKRKHINQNISAWMRKPDIGMVPLFMEGDKQNEYYIKRLASRLGIKLIFYCRGNELENEEFKWGYCGIRNATPEGVIHNLSLLGKIQLVSYYLTRYISNPYYINSSIFDTLFGYFSTYIQKNEYIYLWHYIPWNEEKIITTLTRSYGWEVNPETRTTWRIDDGSPAFYNYLYMKYQGFTENDTFRSNQIREGVISRKNAVELVYEENLPRYKALKWYFDAIGLDGDTVLTVIDEKLGRF